MGGIIEDRLFEVLWTNKLTISELKERLTSIGYDREYGTIGKHLKKMVELRQLSRERGSGGYVYWNSAMIEE